MGDFERRTGVVERVLGGSPVGVLVRLAIISFVVGLIMRALDINPADIVLWLEARLGDLSRLSFGTLEQAGSILLLGAVVVVPIWLIVRALKLMGR